MERIIRVAPTVTHQTRKYGLAIVSNTPDVMGEFKEETEGETTELMLRSIPTAMNNKTIPPINPIAAVTYEKSKRYPNP